MTPRPLLDRLTLLSLTAAVAGCMPDSPMPSAPDGGGAGADAAPFTPTGAIIDFGVASAAFPPTVNKIGFNSVWNATRNDDDHDAFTITRSAAFRAPMIAGLIEPKSLVDVLGYVDEYVELSDRTRAAGLDRDHPALWDDIGGVNVPLFQRTAEGVVARIPTDTDLMAIRAVADRHGLVNFLQIAGTPGTPLPGNRFPTSDSYDNGLFTLVGTPTTGGNWYPVPSNADLPALAHAFGTLPGALGYETRTIYGFWQEPSHTLSESMNAQNSIEKYTRLYAGIGQEFAAQCPAGRCPLGGAQLNANDGDVEPADGYRYRMFMDALRAQRAANPAASIPLDYFTIQNYAAQWNDNVMANARVALGTDSAWTPVLMNEWDYCVNFRAGDGCTPELEHRRYESALAWNALHYLADSITRPDVSHVLVREKILRDVEGDAVTFPWTQVPILFLATMSEFRRPVSVEQPGLPILASGDADQISIIAWNETDAPMSLPLSLVNVPAQLVGKSLLIKRISKAIRDARCPGADVMDSAHTITCWEDVVAPMPLAADLNTGELPVGVGEVIMVLAGERGPAGSQIFADHFVRSGQHVQRDGTTAAPRGAAHFDPHTGSLTVGVQAGGVGAGRIQLARTPARLAVRTRVAGAGLGPSDRVAAGVRVDYLDPSGAVLGTAVFRDDRWRAATVPWASLDWPTSPSTTEWVTLLCGGGCPGGDGSVIDLDLAAHAPSGWLGDAVLGVFVTGAEANAIYRVDLP
ncbi:MAG: hypothetical protein KBG28_15175 [Kofleriaceae bacterium]|jgi:hypothetical protein|nr:hypothetical protein [Kofleriaceae bacterium]